ncbi:hypothetical protein C1X35_22460 [Pseudomonas sp. FW306-1C-G01A]|nr:hypothetical protein C1X56_24340 [Pseudomonas sp. GW101-1A09]PMV92800.1 hypothetical protein C1X51_17310 [Pseudomonas sp. FW306-2-2C-B10A]PMV93685.1 hypothetical protein C1X55_25895 [Pseudomonas sp. GW460-C8]PMW02932.1 hypothetical protein C1X50_23905 [Pseudomonas sp. MPR-TSA4]PMW08805.1 hypothetical protein C1X52_28040 [Pseudomonas sp. FW306-2-1A-C05A]PMW13950.1 hypothetical protein C1X40_23390 [Pseudomonas sp. GW456-11-11-14-TSB2]PMW16069.1 hypothetical protein C1X53_25450 [Pseudomonas s
MGRNLEQAPRDVPRRSPGRTNPGRLSSRNICGSEPLWRGSLLPLACEAGPIDDCFAAEREQDRSPQ